MKKWLLIFPLIVKWTVECTMPIPCPKGQTEDPYLGVCKGPRKMTLERSFTEKQDWIEWYKGIPKDDPLCKVSDIQTYQYDEKGAYIPK